MPGPIKLTSESRKIWAPDFSIVSKLLVNVMIIITESISPGSIIIESESSFKRSIKKIFSSFIKAKGESEAAKYYNEVMPLFIKYFDATNSDRSAVMGAYFRSLYNKDLVSIEEEDFSCVVQVMTSMGINEHHELMLASLKDKSNFPRDAHIAFLKDRLFPELHQYLLKVGSEDRPPILALIDATLTMVDFMCTPFEVLVNEAGGGTEKNSAFDLQWQSTHRGMVTTLDGLLLKVTKPSHTFSKVGNEISRDLVKFQGAYGIQNVRYFWEKQFERQAQKHESQMEEYSRKKDEESAELLRKYQELSAFIHKMDEATKDLPFDINENLKTLIRNYGDKWNRKYISLQKRCEGFEQQLATQRQSADERQPNTEKQVASEEFIQFQQEHEQLRVQLDRAEQELEEVKSLLRLAEQNKRDLTNTIQVEQQKYSHLINRVNENNEQISSLSERNLQLQQQNDSLKQGIEELELQTPPLPPSFPEIKLTIDQLLKQFETKFKNTNSSGIIDIIAYMKEIKNSNLLEGDKLANISTKMRTIGKERKDSSWSKSHFFGKGRHKGVQELYELISTNDFSLNHPDHESSLLQLINEKDKQFTHRL